MSQNILEQVATYNRSDLADLENQSVFIHLGNTQFDDFEKKIMSNLGDTVTFDAPVQMLAQSGLVVNQFQPVYQNKITLTVDQAANVPYGFTAQETIFNVEKLGDYRKKYGQAAAAELGAKVEIDLATICESAPYRFFGNGVTVINSYGQLAKALSYFRNSGVARHHTVGILPDTASSSIIDTGANQFTIDRNNEDVRDWMLGSFSQCEWFESNLLPLHTSGTLAQDQTVLTVTSVTKNASGQITAITFSGAGTDSSAVQQYDLFQFQDNVAGQTNLRFLTFRGHHLSASPVSFSASVATSSSAGNVTITVKDVLDPVATNPTNNINTDIVAGMQVVGVPSHRCGLIMSGDPLFIAFPKLPDQHPYATSVETDPDTGVSLRLTTGATFGQNQYGSIHDIIWGKTAVPLYMMRLVFPDN